MEIEVGEYVRTKNGIIDKVENYSIGCCVWHCQNGMCIDKCNCIGTHLEDIVKHSKNKVELVEAGDYVNGWKVLAKTKTKNNEMKVCILTSFEDEHWITINNETLKTIVTKESFKEREYVF